MPDEALKYRMAFAAIRGMGIDLAQKLLDVLPDEAAVKSPQVESILLVPMGSARLRISAFPVAE